MSMHEKNKNSSCSYEQLEFESEEHAYQWYNEYAKEIGFSIRREYLRRDETGVITNRRFTCSKEGYRVKDKRKMNVKKPRKETRTGCEARMTIALRSNDGLNDPSAMKHMKELKKREEKEKGNKRHKGFMEKGSTSKPKSNRSSKSSTKQGTCSSKVSQSSKSSTKQGTSPSQYIDDYVPMTGSYGQIPMFERPFLGPTTHDFLSLDASFASQNYTQFPKVPFSKEIIFSKDIIDLNQI